MASIKYLGLTIDEKLDWKVHIQELCLTLRKFVGIFYKLSQNLPQHILKMLYFALVYPRILYGIENYANTYLSYLHDLMVLNNRILRILQHSKKSTHTQDLYIFYKTLPIDKLFKYQILLHAHKMMFNPDSLPKVMQPEIKLNNDIHDHLTRSNRDFHRNRVITTIASRISGNVYGKLWNSLPNNLKSYGNIYTFKKHLKLHLYTDNG